MKELTATDIIKLLNLEPLPVEGGFLRQTWSTKNGTAIYYLITPESWSSFHLLDRVEIWHFYAGSPLKQLLLHSNGKVEARCLGSDLKASQLPQSICPSGAWQSTRLIEGGNWALCGTTMSPPFVSNEYHHGNPEELLKLFPDAADLIKEYYENA